jgi:catechol 2,3-dioxygenase
MSTSTQPTPASIHPDTAIGTVTLRVADLNRSLRFYEGVLGFKPLTRKDGIVILGDQANTPLLELRELPGAPAQPLRSTGLYHVAILMPTRADLGLVLLRMAQAGIEIGQGDHLVSEALYISDPDGNGLEIYRDRPRTSWHWTNGAIQMATDPVDIYGLLEEAKRMAEPWKVLPAGTRVGHMHLKVGDIPQAERFYHTILGFDITARMPSALFVSAGGYHHHIGMNIWQSRGAGPAPRNTAGLETFVIALPNNQALQDVRSRLEAHAIAFTEQDNEIVVSDPWQNELRLKVTPPSGSAA